MAKGDGHTTTLEKVMEGSISIRCPACGGYLEIDLSDKDGACFSCAAGFTVDQMVIHMVEH